MTLPRQAHKVLPQQAPAAAQATAEAPRQLCTTRRAGLYAPPTAAEAPPHPTPAANGHTHTPRPAL